MQINHYCAECGFSDWVTADGQKIICPNCATINDWWMDGEEPPERHKDDH